MCRRNRLSGYCCWCLLLTLLFCTGLTAQADEPSETPAQQLLPLSDPSLPTSSPTQTDPWSSFDSLWSSLKTELTESDADSARQLTLLQGLQTEAAALRSSLQESTKRCEESEAARQTEREAYEKMAADAALRIAEGISQRNAARALAAILGGIAGTLGLLLLVF